MNQWQPIETAPHGVWLLLECGSGGVIEGCYCADEDGETQWWDSYGRIVGGPEYWLPTESLPDRPDEPSAGSRP